MTPAVATEKNALNSSLRGETLAAAKRHKASWIELGQYLFTIFKDKHYRGWGFFNFETYCQKELGIKQTTALKLLRSYQFLEKEEPRLVTGDLPEEAGLRSLPNYEAVNILRLAKDHEKLTPQDYNHLRKAVMEAGKEPKEVRAQFKQFLAEREDRDPKEAKREQRNHTIKRLVTYLSSVKREMEGQRLVPDYLLKQIEDLAKKLEDQLE